MKVLCDEKARSSIRHSDAQRVHTGIGGHQCWTVDTSGAGFAKHAEFAGRGCKSGKLGRYNAQAEVFIKRDT
jgi:hypothetical protein